MTKKIIDEYTDLPVSRQWSFGNEKTMKKRGRPIQVTCNHGSEYTILQGRYHRCLECKRHREKLRREYIRQKLNLVKMESR